MVIIKRHELYKEFYDKWHGYIPDNMIRLIFKSTPDNELIKNTGLIVLRKGHFIVKLFGS